MKTVSDIFNTLGGTSATARVMGVKQSAASEMKRRGSIPVRYWAALIEGARSKGVKLNSDVLVEVHSEQGRVE